MLILSCYFLLYSIWLAPSSLLRHANARHPIHILTSRQLSKYPALNNLEAKSGVPKAYAVLGASGLFATFVFFNLAAGFLTTILGWIIPAYFSLKALESPAQGDDTQWLTYWTVFGGFQIVEYFSDFLLYWWVIAHTYIRGRVSAMPSMRGKTLFSLYLPFPYWLSLPFLCVACSQVPLLLHL